MEEAEYLCDRLAIIDHVKIIAIGKPQDLLKKNFSSVVIQFPYSDTLLESISRHFNAELVNDKICVYVENIDNFLYQCSQLKISMHGIQVRDFNLEDLFLKLTGEEIRQ
jgi:ABC-2 type transport system ATP-binding protein